MKCRSVSRCAFTLVEVLVIIAVIAVLVMVRFPALAGTKANVQRVNCSGNLKLVGLAFRSWAASHNDRTPMSVGNPDGGAYDAVGRTATAAWVSGPLPAANVYRGVWWMFLVMSNELATPKILYCPAEGAQVATSVQTPVQASAFGPKTSTVEGFQNDYNVSYFVGVDANDTRPNMFLAGDHNLGTGFSQATKVGNFVAAGTNANWATTAIGWQNNNHSQKGNVCSADGSVQNLTTDRFRDALNKTGAAPNAAVGAGGTAFSSPPGSVGANINRLQFP